MADRAPEPHRFDAFISYSRDDVEFAEWLETKLERYRAPKGIGPGRRLNVFRDIHDLVGSTLPEAIGDALGRSRHLIVVCSPRARESEWVNREVEFFAAANAPERITPVLLEGDPEVRRDSEGACPPYPVALGSLVESPLSADFRCVEGEPRAEQKSRRREALFFVLARLLGVDKETLVRRQRRRTMRLVGVFVALLSLLTVAFALISFEAVGQRNAARDQTRIATSRRLAAQALANLDDRFDMALLLGLHAYAVDPNVDAIGSLLAGLGRNPNLISYLRGHEGSVRDLMFDAEGSRLVSVSDDTIRIWDVVQGRQVDLRPHGGGVRAVHLGPDGRVTTVGESTIDVWSKHPLELERSIPYEPPWGGRTVAINTDGDRLAVAGNFDVSLVDLTDGSPLGAPFRADSDIASLAFSPDGQLLAVGSGSNDVIRLWEVETQRELDPFEGAKATSLVFSQDGLKLASGVRMINLWDVETRQRLARPLVGHGLDVFSLAFTGEGEYLASVGGDGTLRFWNLEQGRQLGRSLRGFGSSVVAISPDGRFMATGGHDGVIALWNIARWDFELQHRLARRLEHADTVSSVVFARDGQQVLAGGEAGRLSVWNPASDAPDGLAAPTLEHEVNDEDIFKQAFDPSGRVLALAHFGFVTLWDFPAGKVLGLIQHGEQRSQHIPAIAFSPDGRLLATGGMDATVRFWDVETRRPAGAPLREHEATITGLAFSPDGTRLASTSYGSVRLWHPATREPIGELLRDVEEVMLGVFLPDDERLIAVGERAVYRWSLPGLDASPPLRLDQAVRPVAVASSPDGRRLALLRTDGTIRIWDLDAARPLNELLRQNEVSGMGFPAWGTLAFSPDGKRLASRGGPTTVRIWDVDVASWRRTTCGIARRNFSRPEWDRFLGTTDAYCRVCPTLSAGKGMRVDAPECSSPPGR